ncbi:hypothetical protein PAHAL_2G418100 [Panicum hallii]|uniref:Uncharacterized protein n=1 Tax=Panicum hallii TaxID=206008 RepID=A0A2S3H3E1_9POAL|nr:hypothetical protein PAHAL_2G418100 [Panicum hallii]
MDGSLSSAGRPVEAFTPWRLAWRAWTRWAGRSWQDLVGGRALARRSLSIWEIIAVDWEGDGSVLCIFLAAGAQFIQAAPGCCGG